MRWSSIAKSVHYFLTNFCEEEIPNSSVLFYFQSGAGFGEDEDVGSLQWAKPLANPQGPKEIGMDWSRGRWDKPPTAAGGVVTILQSSIFPFILLPWKANL